MTPKAPGIGKLAGYRGPERTRLVGRELYLYYPEGIGRSRLNPFIDRNIEDRGTARNWNTVSKLAQICSAMEAE